MVEQKFKVPHTEALPVWIWNVNRVVSLLRLPQSVVDYSASARFSKRETAGYTVS